jgi:hypothetical protein
VRAKVREAMSRDVNTNVNVRGAEGIMRVKDALEVSA